MASTSDHSQKGHAVEVLATVAHDIRNYLQNILCCTELLLEEQEVGEPFRHPELLRQLRRNALGAHLLTANYLDLNRIEAGQLSLTRQPVDIDELLHQVGSRYTVEAQRKQITLEWQSPEHLPVIWGEAVALERVFSNLVHNAVKFTPAHGRILLSVDHRGAEIAVAVEDTGCGIAPTDQAMIFANGGRATANNTHQGIGLGLFIVKTLVEAHAGRITIESALGQGSRFTVFLPCELS